MENFLVFLFRFSYFRFSNSLLVFFFITILDVFVEIVVVVIDSVLCTDFFRSVVEEEEVWT